MQEAESIPVSMISEGSDASAEAEAGTPLIGAGQRIQDEGEACVFAASEQHENDTEKENEMIDVHAPQGGIHTWRDFWIHLGTIALGLLIAIGLEQTVEWMHHLHQRHQLEEDLRAEAVKNLAIMDGDYRVCDIAMAHFAANRERVDAMRAGHGTVKLSYIPFPERLAKGAGLAAPLASVWTTAKESELVALLPRDQARFYDRVYRQLDTAMAVSDHAVDVGRQLTNFEARFAAVPKTPWDPIYPDLSRMSMEQLDQESALLTEMWLAVEALRTRLDYFYAAETAVLQGGFDGNISAHIVHRPPMRSPDLPDAAATDPNNKPEKP